MTITVILGSRVFDWFNNGSAQIGSVLPKFCLTLVVI